MTVVKDVSLVPTEPQGLAADSVSLFERLASDPNISVEKIERLMALWERGEDKKAEAAFHAAMADAQREMRPVAADASNPQTRSRYASYQALDSAVRPIYTAHGFGLSFNTGEAPAADFIRITCDVSHRSGHLKVYRLDLPADGKGAKGGDVMTKTHATGSALSYGMRYLLKMIFNIAVGEDDDDGNKAGRPAPDVKAPDGFEKWWDDIQAVADNGWADLKEAWNKSPEPFRKHVERQDPRGFEALKRRAKATK